MPGRGIPPDYGEMHNPTRAISLGLFALLAGCLDDGTGPSGSDAFYQVTIPDAVGDALFDDRVASSPDLVAVHIRIEADTFHVDAEYAPGADLPQTYLAVSIDSDGSIITGEAVDGHGVDFVVAIGAGTGAGMNVVVLRYQLNGYLPFAGPVPLEITANGLSGKVPLSLLGGLDGGGMMTVRASTHHRLATEWTPVLDFAPDEPDPPALMD